MKRWLMVIAASIVSMEAYAQTNTPTGMDFYQSCMAAAGIVGGHPLPTAHAMKEEVELAQACFAAVTAVMELEPLLAPPYRMCPAAGEKVSYAQAHLVIAEHLKNHPEQLHNSFYILAASALHLAWPCAGG